MRPLLLEEMMEINATVEVYTGPHKERQTITLTENDLRKICEDKALAMYNHVSAQTLSIEFKTTV